MYQLEIIIREEFLKKLRESVQSLNRQIWIVEHEPLPSKIAGIRNYKVLLYAGDLESIFFAGAAFGIPEKSKWSSFFNKLFSWITR